MAKRVSKAKSANIKPGRASAGNAPASKTKPKAISDRPCPSSEALTKVVNDMPGCPNFMNTPICSMLETQQRHEKRMDEWYRDLRAKSHDVADNLDNMSTLVARILDSTTIANSEDKEVQSLRALAAAWMIRC